jgi:hypothetical protein
MATQKSIIFNAQSWDEIVQFAVSLSDVPKLNPFLLAEELKKRVKATVSKATVSSDYLSQSIGVEASPSAQEYIITFTSQMMYGEQLDRKMLIQILSKIEADIKQAMRVTELTGLLATDE